MTVGVLLDDTLARAPSQLLRQAGLIEQSTVRAHRLVGVPDEQDLLLRLQPSLDPFVRTGDDRGAAGGELEKTRRRRRPHDRMRPPRHVEVDPAGGDGAPEAAERDRPKLARAADRATEAMATDREVDL